MRTGIDENTKAKIVITAILASAYCEKIRTLRAPGWRLHSNLLVYEIDRDHMSEQVEASLAFDHWIHPESQP